MAINFARFDFVGRSTGKNACASAAYQNKSTIQFKGNEFSPQITYSWDWQPRPIYNEILLPNHVKSKFKDSEYLWNTVEEKETRINSQTFINGLLALPDDQVISIEEKIHLAKSFLEENFVKLGLAVEVSVHAPEENNHNWHAHFMATTRSFSEDGEFLDKKIRNLLQIRKGKAITHSQLSKLWAEFQNAFFEKKGIDLRVDPSGVVPQIHLGPVRMRARAFSLLEEHANLLVLNKNESQEPKKILDAITEHKSIFTIADVDRFLNKHLDADKISEVREAFWKQSEIVQLFDSKSHQPTNKFSTEEIFKEERKLLRLVESIKKSNDIKIKDINQSFSEKLTPEQQVAYTNILKGDGLSSIEGHAGVGKSYLLSALRYAYEEKGYKVRAFGPDSSTAKILAEHNFHATNVYNFLFSVKNGKTKIEKNQEVWLVDEAGKLGNLPTLELFKFAKASGAKLVLSGNSAQMSAVSRGDIFTKITESYGAEVLEDIQRQKKLSHKEMAKNLAQGEMAKAVDQISRSGGLKWVESKKEAIVEMVKEWEKERIANSNEEPLMIAFTNAEVKALNEMVRLSRKSKGEISDEEYKCNTVLGTTYVSRGDKIEFKKNSKELGVSNGDVGILIEASEKSFKVCLTSGKSRRNVEFNPSEYHNFQLGYASTVVRSQGETASKVLALYSPIMSRKEVYVSLTRHVHDVSLYIPKSDVKNLSELKYLAMKERKKETTLEYSTEEELKNTVESNQKKKNIEELKTSEFLTSRLKGQALDAWDNLKIRFNDYRQDLKDSKISEPFFNPQIKNSNIKAGIVKLQNEDIEVKDLEIPNNKQNPRKIAKDKIIDWSVLPNDKATILRMYFSSSVKAQSIKLIVEAEANGKREMEKHTPHYSKWMESCSERNKCAYDVKHHLTEKQLKHLLSSGELQKISNQSSSHEKFLNYQQKSSVESKIKDNLELIIYNLFPEGPNRRDSKGFRFGRNGSLSIVCQGEKAGLYFDYEKNEGGSVLQLIKRNLNLNHSKALEWVNNCLGENKNTKLPSQFTIKSKNVVDDSNWVSLKPLKEDCPKWQNIRPTLSHYYYENAMYTYKNAKGETLYYVLRLLSKDSPGKKIILPISYGYVKGEENNPKWEVKGYKMPNEPRTLYNLDLISQYPQSKILIVEGEKAADAASAMFKKEDFICITWPGGASSASNSDWLPLYARDVVIWPDNDKAGIEAAENVCNHLRMLGVRSLKMIGSDMLKNLPEKWDLADPLPQNLENNFIKQAILRGESKAVDVMKLTKYCGYDTQELIRYNDVLWRVDNRLRLDLEAKNPNDNGAVERELLKETERIVSETKNIIPFDSYTSDALRHKAGILMAEKGIVLSDKDVGMIKKDWNEFEKMLAPSKKVDVFIKEHVYCDSVCSKMALNERADEKSRQLNFKNEINNAFLFVNSVSVKEREIHRSI